jgi:Holliday junction resolvase RusA-like endonuclease
METLTFTILGIPTAKQSMKFTRNGFSYQTKEVKLAADNMRAQIIQQLPAGFKPLTEPVNINYYFAFPFTSDISKKQRNLISCGEIHYKAKKPDIDNLQKAVNDALNGVVISDDSLICEVHASKCYSETPRTEILIGSCKMINNEPAASTQTQIAMFSPNLTEGCRIF